jgi:hypothetical protein
VEASQARAQLQAALRSGIDGMQGVVGALVRARVAVHPELAGQVEEALAVGCFLRLEFGTGAAGPIGLGLYAVAPGGEVTELVYIGGSQ